MTVLQNPGEIRKNELVLITTKFAGCLGPRSDMYRRWSKEALAGNMTASIATSGKCSLATQNKVHAFAREYLSDDADGRPLSRVVILRGRWVVDQGLLDDLQVICGCWPVDRGNLVGVPYEYGQSMVDWIRMLPMEEPLPARVAFGEEVGVVEWCQRYVIALSQRINEKTAQESVLQFRVKFREECQAALAKKDRELAKEREEWEKTDDQFNEQLENIKKGQEDRKGQLEKRIAGADAKRHELDDKAEKIKVAITQGYQEADRLRGELNQAATSAARTRQLMNETAQIGSGGGGTRVQLCVIA